MFSASDIKWARDNYGLSADGNTITGRLAFRMLYSRSTGGYIIRPNPEDVLADNTIFHADDYEVRIVWPASAAFPICVEVDDKVKAVAISRNLPLGEMHVNPSGDFCLASPQELTLKFKTSFSLQVYVEQYLIPFLFQQTHYRNHSEWAWKPAGHGIAGILGWYHLHCGEHSADEAMSLTMTSIKASPSNSELAMLKKLRKANYKGHMPCLCGSDKRIRNCCPEALYGVNALRNEVITYLVKELSIKW